MGMLTNIFLLNLLLTPSEPTAYSTGNTIGSIYLGEQPFTVVPPTFVNEMYSAVAQSIIAPNAPINVAILTIPVL